MTGPALPAGADGARRGLVAGHAWLQGIDYVEVLTGYDAGVPLALPPAEREQRVLAIHFLPKSAAAQPNLDAFLAGLAAAPERVTVHGGQAGEHIPVTEAVVVQPPQRPAHLAVAVARRGDASSYTLAVAPVAVGVQPVTDAAMDPAYAACTFRFKAGCYSSLDCRTPEPPELPDDGPPRLDYMARDYASLRRLLLDELALRVPGWREGNPADLGVTLVEALAYAGDHLAYHQDAVAAEAFLETARHRVSARRHARLVDYEVDDGASAQTVLHVRLGSGQGRLPQGTQALTRLEPEPGWVASSVLSRHDAARALDAAEAVFETVEDAALDARLDDLPIHAWGRERATLAEGATQADLAADVADLLRPDALLLFEEAPWPGGPDVPDARRQLVRVRSVERAADPLDGTLLTRVAWDPDDALRFPLDLTQARPDGATSRGRGLAQGNLVLACQGRTTVENLPGPGAAHPLSPRHHAVTLSHGPLSHWPRPRSDEVDGHLLAASQLAVPTGPGAGVADPKVQVDVKAAVPSMATQGPWTPARDFVLRGPLDRSFAVEMDNDGRALLRFGDGDIGMAPPPGCTLRATYRVGLGAAGNVGSGALVHLVPPEPLPWDWPDIAGVRNPLPAWGGRDPQPMEAIRQSAPAALRAHPQRAVTEADYREVAERHPAVERARAVFRWTGSWHTVFLHVDPKGRAGMDPALAQRIQAWVERFVQAGYDLAVRPPDYVPLEVELVVCVEPGHRAADVERAVRQALLAAPEARREAHGRGFFHPDNFSFGDPVRLGGLYAAVQAVPGVGSAEVASFKRLHARDRGERGKGLIEMAQGEVARLDGDPAAPDHGVLRITVRGGT